MTPGSAQRCQEVQVIRVDGASLADVWVSGLEEALRWHRRAACAWQGRLQSQDLGKHLAGVEDLLQLHELVEADIAVQAERVRAVSASALRFCDPGKGDICGEELERGGAGRENSKSWNSKTGKTWGQER